MLTYLISLSNDNWLIGPYIRQSDCKQEPNTLGLKVPFIVTCTC